MKTYEKKIKAMRADTEKLYWNNFGEILCGMHAPIYLSDTWRSEQWKEFDDATRAKVDTVIKFKCEVCRLQEASSAIKRTINEKG